MSHNSGTKRAVARGGMIFAAVTLLVSGVFSILMGVVAVANRAFFATVGNYTYAVSLRGWGWAHIIGGAIVAIVGLGLFSGALWARGLGIVVAALSAIGNFFFIPYYPIWTLLIIALDVFVIWSLATAPRAEARHGDRRAMEAGAPMADDQRWASTNAAAGYGSDMSGRRASDMANRGTGDMANRGTGAPMHGDAQREQASMGQRGGASQAP
jgi:hypothetical protein